nr:hypothetical protein ANI_1_156174 [Aspergillus niger CBS 513.88]|eukprot:XP_001402421.2 hypothetical protein ANI_1_156174 [Aspergillus niger CBS 513.88]
MESDGEKVKVDRESLKRSRMEFEDDGLTEDGSEYNGIDDSEEEEWWKEDDSEDLGHEQDIEEHEYTTSGGTARTVRIRLFLTNEADEETDKSSWMRNFVAECTCDGVVVATALARYIHREAMRSEFWEKMEVPSEETCDVAFHVFDRYGTVKAKYKDHPVQKGTGVWGNELDHGPLFLIENLHITTLNLRRKGLGQKIVSLLLNKARLFCLDDKPDGEHADYVYGSSEAFELAWTLHALSRTLAASSDFDLRRSDAEDLEIEQFEVRYERDPFTDVKEMRMKRLRDALPLHHAALTLMDEELKAFFAAHADDKIGWDRVSNSEATLLHLTACEFKPLSTQWLLENVRHADCWKTARNIDGLKHLDFDVRKNLKTNKSLRKGFVKSFQIAVECLKAKKVPTAETLEWCRKNRSEWPPDTKNYLRRTGTQMGCRAVLLYMFDAAREEDIKAGDGLCQRTLKKEWSDLPTCRNDHEFGFVARACGYGGDNFISLPCW